MEGQFAEVREKDDVNNFFKKSVDSGWGIGNNWGVTTKHTPEFSPLLPCGIPPTRFVVMEGAALRAHFKARLRNDSPTQKNGPILGLES
jgi:hypothetical protein